MVPLNIIYNLFTCIGFSIIVRTFICFQNGSVIKYACMHLRENSGYNTRNPGICYRLLTMFFRRALQFILYSCTILNIKYMARRVCDVRVVCVRVLAGATSYTCTF